MPGGPFLYSAHDSDTMNGMYDVITIGTATRDAFLVLSKLAQGPYYRTIRDKRFATGGAECFSLGSKIQVPEIVFATGGGATNAAVTFSRQGLKTACFCVVGSDVSGETVMRELRRECVDFLFRIDSHASHKTGYSIILLSPSGERTILTYRGASEDFKESMVPWAKLKSRWLYLGPLGGAANEAFPKVLQHARRRGIQIALNPSGAALGMGLPRFARLMRGIRVLIVNEEEASRLTGVPYGNERAVFTKLDKAIGGIVVMTCGPKGVVVSDGVNVYRAGIFRERRLLDRTGAGDAFGSGFVAGLLSRSVRAGKPVRSSDMEYAIRMASANATSVVEAIGAKEGILTRTAFVRARHFSHLSVVSEDEA